MTSALALLGMVNASPEYSRARGMSASFVDSRASA